MTYKLPTPTQLKADTDLLVLRFRSLAAEYKNLTTGETIAEPQLESGANFTAQNWMRMSDAVQSLETKLAALKAERKLAAVTVPTPATATAAPKAATAPAKPERKSADQLVSEATAPDRAKKESDRTMAIELLERVRKGEISADEACRLLKAAK